MYNIELEVTKTGVIDELNTAISCGEIMPEDVLDFFTKRLPGLLCKPKKATAAEGETFPDFDALDRNGVKDKSITLSKMPTTAAEVRELSRALKGIPGCDIVSGEEAWEAI